MSNSVPGRVPLALADTPLTQAELITRFQAAMYRASDALWRVHSNSGDELSPSNLGYVHDQLGRAIRDLKKAQLCLVEAEALELADKPATADMLDLADEADLLIDKHAVKPTEGGAS